ncbi:DUF86 domain-containing protein [Candidatus Woesearchaeota archaeon]|nr:DUF86 domain-containing protein [Candidatus Woesearchaeota archaeon]
MTTTKIRQKIREIEDSLEIIKEGLPEDVGEFLSLGLVKDGIYKRLEFVIQAVVDIFSMIYSLHRLGVPGTVDDIFGGLAQKRIFPKSIIALAQEMKGLRNILIHRYGKINDETIYELLTERLGDFEKIMNAIEKWLSSGRAESGAVPKQ